MPTKETKQPDFSPTPASTVTKEEWTVIQIEKPPIAAYDIMTSERGLGTNLEYRDAKAVVSAHNAALSVLQGENTEREADNIKNEAWFNVLSEKLGSTQLTHAVAKIEALQKENDRLAKLVKIQHDFGCAGKQYAHVDNLEALQRENTDMKDEYAREIENRVIEYGIVREENFALQAQLIKAEAALSFIRGTAIAMDDVQRQHLNSVLTKEGPARIKATCNAYFSAPSVPTGAAGEDSLEKH